MTITRTDAARAEKSARGSCTINHSRRLVTLGPEEPLSCQGPSLPPPSSRRSPFRLRPGNEAGRPRPAPVDRPARSQADDGGAEDQVPAPGRRRHEPQRAERGQLRRVEGQPLPEPARPPDPEERREGHDPETVVEQAAAGDRRGLRPGGLRPGPQGRAQGDVGSDRDDRGEGRRRGGRHQEAGGPRRQCEVPADQGRHPAHADDAGRRQGAGPGDDGVRLRRLRPRPGGPPGKAATPEGDARSRRRRPARRAGSGAAADRRGSSRSSPRAGATPSSSPTASRPTTAPA